MEDSDDKVRRNVVAFACAIIAGTFLGISVTKGSLFGIEIKTAYPNRVWLLLLIVSIYFLQRYHFAVATETQRQATRSQAAGRISNAFLKIIRNDLDRVARRKKPPRYLVPFVEGGLLFRAQQRPGTGPITGAFYVSGMPPSYSDGRSLRQLLRAARSSKLMIDEATYVSTVGGESQLGVTEAGYKLPAWRAAFAAVPALLAFLIHSKQSVDLLVPYFLGVAATTICGYRLAIAAHTYWAPWVSSHWPW